MSEKITTQQEFEQIPREIEQKFLPIFPQKLDKFHRLAIPIEQIYLSHPSEEYNLRIRQTRKDDKISYKATLKDSGTVTAEGIDRLEIETPVDAGTFTFYRRLGRPAVRKYRAEPAEGIVIDYFEDGHVHAESENPVAWHRFLDEHQLHDNFEEVTGDRITDNEWRAHFDYRRTHDGKEALTPAPNLDVDEVCLNIVRHQIESPSTLVRIAGRSGSGKSTVVRELQQKLDQVNLPSVVISTDDYHRGKALLTHLNDGKPWTNWDSSIVYDLQALTYDLAMLRSGGPIPTRQFNFVSEEPEVTGTTHPTPVIIVEGIYAGHHLFDQADLSYEVPTPLATCIGRRVMRDLVERPQFADPTSNLRYMLEYAEPAWIEQHELNTSIRHDREQRE